MLAKSLSAREPRALLGKTIMDITRELVEAQRRPRFGTANPERMRLEFWEWMIRGDPDPQPVAGLLGEHGINMRNGMLKSHNGPWRVRDLFEIPLNREEGPIWNFDRMGQTVTPLDDGRTIYIAGEHEDFYDPDFHIYDDVVVLTPDDEIEIYGYPEAIFPPTDFHTATLLGNQIIIIGCVGYAAQRRDGFTPVYTLNLDDYSIESITTTGEMPGWISDHEAEYTGEGIRLRGGKVNRLESGKPILRSNDDDFLLDPFTWTWRRETDRRWSRFEVLACEWKRDDLDQLTDFYSATESFIPETVEWEETIQEFGLLKFRLEGYPVTINLRLCTLEILIEGPLDETIRLRLLEECRVKLEQFVERPCKWVER
jgi:hypothetical protein